MQEDQAGERPLVSPKMGDLRLAMPAGKEEVATPPVLVMSWPVLLTWPFYRTGSGAERTAAPFPRGQEG